MERRIKPILPFLYSAVTSFPFSEFDFDAMTDYEFNQALRCKLNEIIGAVNNINSNLVAYVSDKIDMMKEDGTLDEIINQTLFERYNIFYTPEDFGGVGDGVTDCTAAFDAACEAMNSGDIKILFIPAGKTYLIKTTIGIPAGCMLIGDGPTSVIYYDETITDFGVGITNAGDNVVIANLKVNHANNTRPIPPAGKMAGAISVGCLNHIGAVEAGVEYTRVNRKNCVVSDIWTDYGRYCLQTENSPDYTLENVYVNNIFAPDSMVSIAPRNNNMTNVHYNNIRCHMLRTGAYSNSGYGGNAISVNNFYCKYVQARGKKAVFNNGVIDSTGSIYHDRAYAVNLESGNIFNNCQFIGEAGNVETAILANGIDDNFRFNNCDFSGFTRFWRKDPDIELPAPVYFNSCNISQTGTASAPLQGAAVMCDIDMTMPSELLRWPEV